MPHDRHALLGLLTALDRFAEATGAASQDRKRAAAASQAEALIAKVFKAQGRAFARALRSAAVPATATDAARLEYWLAAWDHVAKALRKSMTAAVEAGIRQSFDLGQSTVVDQVRAATVTLRARTAREAAPPTGEIQGGFRAKDPRAQAYINQHAAALVTGIDDTTRKRLAKMLQAGLERGDSITKLTNAIADQFTEFSQDRAKLIATTEINNAFAAGQLAAAAEMHARGLDFEKHWRSRRDGRVEAECMANDEQGWILVDRPFTSGHDRPLAHPRCRCIMLTRMAAETGAPTPPTAMPEPSRGATPTAPAATGGGAGGNIPRPPAPPTSGGDGGGEDHIKADLQAIAQRFILDPGTTQDEFAASWVQHLAMRPSEWVAQLTAGLPGTPTVARAKFEGARLQFEIGLHRGDELVMDAERWIDFASGVAEHRGLFVYGDNRGKNIGTVFIRNSYEFYGANGINLVDVDAGSDNGGYVWARLGFVPTDWPALRTQLQERYDAKKSQLSDDEREGVEFVLTSDDPHRLFLLTTQEGTIDGIKVGRSLLNGTRWRGRLDRDDPIARRRFERYVQGAEVDNAE